MKTFCKIFAAILILALVSCQTQESQPAAPKQVPDNAAAAFVQDMGIGINIGNTLDAIGTATWTAGETGWGNPKITLEFIQALKNYGYSTIRLPVTWAENIGPGPEYRITLERMNRVEEVVNWILSEDMYCILNLHHDGGTSDKSWILNAADDPEGTTKQFAAVWNQIAVRFADASGKLILEAMNEVGFNKLWDQWNPSTRGGKPEAYRLLNQLNQTFVDTIRASGSLNESRFLLVSGYWTDIDLTCDPLFQMPKDAGSLEDRLILSVHYYTPAVFCILEKDESWGKNQTDWGSRTDYAELSSQFAKIKNRFIDNGIPVILGEYGVSFSKTKVEAARARWITAVTQICLDNGICPVLWDTGNDIKRLPPYELSEPLKNSLASINGD
jgi:endoglucanase